MKSQNLFEIESRHDIVIDVVGPTILSLLPFFLLSLFLWVKFRSKAPPSPHLSASLSRHGGGATYFELLLVETIQFQITKEEEI